jgi:hypothetical protein
MGIAYFEVDYLPGKPHFLCAAHRTTLSVESCAAQYRRHKGGCSACTCCEVGAGHAGETIKPRLSARLCARCGRTDLRLISGYVCIGCYNRQREYLLGRNAKGHFPSHARHIRATDVFVSGVGRTHLDRVADVSEAILVVLRRNPDSMVRPMFAPVPLPQLNLFGWAA